MPSHDHTAAKDLVFGIQPGRCLAFITREEPLNHRASMGIEILRDTLPVNIFDPLQNAVRLFREEYVHMSALRQIRTTITILAAISIFNTPNLALEFHPILKDKGRCENRPQHAT